MNTFTLVHILISLAGIATGLVAAGSWVAGRESRGWTAWFFVTTALTSITGFFFPIRSITPGLAVGVLSLVVLAVALYALCARKLSGRWRSIFAGACMVALYFNFFVLVAQVFQKTPSLLALAPTQAEPPFAISQGLVFALFVVLGIAAVRGFRRAVT